MKKRIFGITEKYCLLKPGLFLLLTCLLTLSLSMAPAKAQVPGIIFDSDMSSDHDDIADLAVLEGLADLGECNILACMTSSQNGGTPLCMNAINNYFGRPNVPSGIRPDTGGLGAYPATIATEFPHPLYATYTDCPLAANLYRQVLASQPDHSVIIVTTGYLNNLQALMQTGPDSYSSLNGMDLIRQKVKLLACAGGAYPSGDEFNFKVEPAAANYVINNWPVSAFYDGFDVGQDIYSGGELQNTPTTNPIRRGFELTFFGPYPTWGQLMIYYAVRPAEAQILWNYNTTGKNTVDATGHNIWVSSPDPSGAQEQGYMIEIQRFPIQQAIDTLVMNSGAPKSKGTVYPPNQPTNLRATVADSTINLQWTDNSWNETGFKIERKINGVFTQIGTVGANVTTFSDPGLATTANVAYRVKAYNAIGDSGTNPANSIVGSGAFPVGPAGYATVTVYSGGWTETNLTNPSDHTPIYNYYQYDNLNWARGPNVCANVAVNNDSTTGQDVTVNVMLGAQGAYGRYYVYFLYQDQNNWYRINTGSSGQGASNYNSRFEKCVNGTITQIGAQSSEGINMGNGALMQTWQIVVSHTGTMTFFTNNNPTGNANPTMHQVLSVSDTYSFSTGKIALGTDIGQPVWDNFSFDTTGSGGGGTAPGVPSGLSATAGNAQVTLNWSAGSGATSYNIYRGTSANGEGTTPIATGITSTSYTNTGLSNGTGYYYKVAAVNSSGTSGYSTEASATPSAGGSAPSAPASLGTTTGNTQVSLSWAASSGATSYNVYRGTTAGGESTTPLITGLTSTSYINTGLTNGTTYYYKVAGVNTFGTSGYSNEASATPTAGGGGGGSGTSIGIQFVASGTALAASDSAGVPAVAQTHWVTASGSTFSGLALTDSTGASTSAALSGGADGIYRGGGAFTGGNATLVSGELFDGDINNETHSVTIASIPYGTYDVYVYGGCDAGGRNATFTVTSAGGATLSKSFQTTSSASSWIEGTNTWNGSGTAPTLSAGNYVKFTGLTATSFTLKFGGVGNVGMNGIQIVGTSTGGGGGGSAPAAPTGLSASAGNAQVSLSWSASSGATSYNVYRGTSAGGESATPIATGLTSTSYTNTGLSNGMLYYYKVAAVNSIGTSGYSNEASATPTAPGGGGSASPIGIQFVGSGTALTAATSAGVPAVAQTHWKTVTGSSFSGIALTDSTGAGTTATLSGSASGIYFSGSLFSGGNATLCTGELFNNDINTITNSITITAIPFSHYDVYVYGACDAGGRNATFTVTPSGGATSSRSFQTQSAASTWTEGTSTWDGSGTAPTLSPGNYVRFPGLSATSFTLKFGGVGNVGMNGIQIVPVP